MKKQTRNIFFKLLALPIFIVLVFAQCKKDTLTQDKVKLEFSTDTLSFDTLFTTLGSTTKSIRVRNPFNQTLEVGRIKLSDTTSSYFRINVDGISGKSFDNIQILPKDSIYIFIEVTVNPSESELPFLIENAILFESGAQKQKVVLQAYGQNARFYNNAEITSETWTKDLPYVILGDLKVKEGNTLNIKEGVKVYMGSNAGIFVAGNVNIEGTFEEPVTIRGLRLDKISPDTKYDEIPGQWLGIFLLRDSKNNQINYTKIRNAQFGISMGSSEGVSAFNNATLANAPELTIKNSIIYNISVFGLYGVLSNIVAENLLIYDCGSQVLALQAGGEYSFTHCTFQNQGTQFLTHKDPSIYISNYFSDPIKSIDIRNSMSFSSTNSILYGSLFEEILIDSVASVGYDFNLSNCLVKTRLNSSSTNLFDNCLFNENPQFEDEKLKDFRLKLESLAINFGKATAVTSDLNNNLRDTEPDLGVYEYIP